MKGLALFFFVAGLVTPLFAQQPPQPPPDAINVPMNSAEKANLREYNKNVADKTAALAKAQAQINAEFAKRDEKNQEIASYFTGQSAIHSQEHAGYNCVVPDPKVEAFLCTKIQLTQAPSNAQKTDAAPAK